MDAFKHRSGAIVSPADSVNCLSQIGGEVRVGLVVPYACGSFIFE